MKNTGRILLFSSFGLGNIILLFTRFYGDRLSDFMLGFYEGVSIAFIISGASYLMYCAVKGVHPLKEKSKEFVR